MWNLVFSAVLVASSFAFADAKIAGELDGRYTYLAPDEEFNISRFEIEIKSGRLNFPGNESSVKNIEISEGAQDDFTATLKGKAIPAGFSLYKLEADLKGAGEAAKLTMVKQVKDDQHPRLTLYWVDQEAGRGFPVIQAYDNANAAQMTALESALKDLGSDDEQE